MLAIVFIYGRKDKEAYDKKIEANHNKYDALLREEKEDTKKRIEELKVEIKEAKENNRNLIKNDTIIRETEEKIITIDEKVDIINKRSLTTQP